jgi:hypothetical protein
LLWDIQQPREQYKRQNKGDTNNKLKRMGGPGEIRKGEFKSD